MTDISLADAGILVQPQVGVSSQAVTARVNRRNRAEKRFRLYGITAVLFAVLCLLVLLADIVTKAWPAFTQSRLLLAVPVTTEAFDAKNLNAGDFDGAVRDGLRQLFPTVTSRTDKKALYAILSSGASDALRRQVIASPGLIGQSLKIPVTLSSDADLYLKGSATRTHEQAAAFNAKVSATSGSVVVDGGAGAFAVELATIKKITLARAEALQGEATRLSTAAQSVSADLKVSQDRIAAATAAGQSELVATNEALAKKSTESKAALDSQATTMREKAEKLRNRAADLKSAENLDTAMPSLLVVMNGGVIKATSVSVDRITGDAVVPLVSDGEAQAGAWKMLVVESPEDSRKIQDRQIAFLENLKQKGVIQSVFNWPFFANGDSREPELAGILGALAGSALTMLITLLLCLPIGVGAAVYLEEFAPKNRITSLIEVNINNLAAVPSIVFGLLGLAMFLNFFGMPRSSPLVGGLVLALLVLPTIIIASRAALKSVPPSIREAALGIGASRQQAVFHHVLPLAMPGIMTGTIIGMAHALGETAPLLMIGMIAFIVDVPARITDAATVLPVQIYLWSDLPELGFQAKTAAAIVVLLLFLFVMNGLAIVLRKRFEIRW
jgi:phosphate transport system permease protein